MSRRQDKLAARVVKLREARDEWCSAAVTSAAQAKAANDEVQELRAGDREIGIYIDVLNDENAGLRDEVKTLTQRITENELKIKELKEDATEHRKSHKFFFDLLNVLGVSQDDVFNTLDHMGTGMSLRDAFARAIGKRLPPSF